MVANRRPIDRRNSCRSATSSASTSASEHSASRLGRYTGVWGRVTGGRVADRIRKLLRVTPLIPAPALGRRTGADVWLKLESLQRTGSFKLRGAAARLAAMSLEGKTRAIAASAGNHGLG